MRTLVAFILAVTALGGCRAPTVNPSFPVEMSEAQAATELFYENRIYRQR